MKKLNWGISIAIFYGTFVVVLIGFVFYTTTIDYDLVAEDYYDKELKYQEQIDKIKRSKALHEKLTVETNNNAVKFQFPKYIDRSELSGKIYFYRPSDKALDFYVPVAADDENKQIVATQKLKEGLWTLKVEWVKSDSSFYDEFNVVLGESL